MSTENDPIDDVITAAIHSLRAASMTVNVSTITVQLTDVIVDSYDGVTSLFVCKTNWCNSIIRVLTSLDISFNKSRPNWERIAMLIHDKKLGIIHSSADPAARCSNNIGESHSLSGFTTKDSNTDTASSSSSTTKQPKLSNDDKAKIKSMYDNLDDDSMWKLSTGTIVEKKMEQFALACNFEHPVHSLILDTDDRCWKEFFTEDELYEIKTFKMKKLCDLPGPLIEYIDSLKLSADYITLKKKLIQESQSPACEWVRSTILEYIKLFHYRYLPLSNQSEGDMLRRIWFFIDTVFDDSSIECRGGEKSSKSSSASRNEDRTLAGLDRMERKLMGRKVDMVYIRQRLEYGCCECGRYDDQTKELYDGGFKMVKVLKDMLYNLYKSAPNPVRDLTLVGFLLFETKFTLMLSDSPAGYICRINRMTPVGLPEEADDISNQLLSILKVVYQARLTMENTNRLIRQSPTVVGFGLDRYKTVIPCFNSQGSMRKRSRSITTIEE